MADAPQKPVPPKTASVKTGDEWRRGDHDDQPTKPRRQFIRPAFNAVWQFLKYMITLPVALVRGRRSSADELTVYSAHPSFFLWLLIVVGFISSAIVAHAPGWANFFGWLYVWVLLYFVVTLLYDFSTKKLALWVLIFTLVWLTSRYFEQLRHVTLLSSVFDYLRSLQPRLDRGTVTVLSWLFLLPWIGSLLHMALNGRKRFSPNEISEYHFGEGSELTDRTGLRFRTRYRDVLEMILTFGGGDLIAIDSHQNVIKRWDNIVGLFFFWNQLDRILHQRAVVESAEDNDKP